MKGLRRYESNDVGVLFLPNGNFKVFRVIFL